MYEEFYGLKEKPFSLTPDPRFLFLSVEHRNALELLLYGIRRREGFALLTGGIGTGKTILCRALVERLGPNAKVALILNPMLSEEELLQAILQDMGLDHNKSSRKELMDELNSFLLNQALSGGTIVLILDEAQNLSVSVLEQIRILSNLETEKEKLIQIVLVGQEELGRKLELPSLIQLNQRISVRCHLGPLAKDEVLRYIEHRLMIAGSSSGISFLRGAINVIYKHSHGIPRIINLICDRALLGGYVQQTYHITRRIAKKSVKELKAGEVVPLQKLISMRAFRFALISLLPALLIVAFLVLKMNRSVQKLIPGGTDTASAVSLNNPNTEHVVKSSEAVKDENEGVQSPPTEGYVVHVFSHRDRSEAERMLEALQSEGYTLDIETANLLNGLWYRVVSKYFPDLDSSIEMVRDLARMDIHAKITYRREGSKPASVELYRISLGLYERLTNAEDLVTRLKHKGYTAYTSKTERDLYEVFMGPYASEDDCRSTMKTLQSYKSDFPIMTRYW